MKQCEKSEEYFVPLEPVRTSYVTFSSLLSGLLVLSLLEAAYYPHKKSYMIYPISTSLVYYYTTLLLKLDSLQYMAYSSSSS